MNIVLKGNLDCGIADDKNLDKVVEDNDQDNDKVKDEDVGED